MLVIFVYYILQNTLATTCARSSHSEDGGSKYLRNVRTRFSSRCETPKDIPSFEEPPLCKPENLHIATVYCVRLVLYQCLRATWPLHLCTRLYGVTSQHTATTVLTARDERSDILFAGLTLTRSGYILAYGCPFCA